MPYSWAKDSVTTVLEKAPESGAQADSGLRIETVAAAAQKVYEQDVYEGFSVG
jgi:hypothetical protein